MESIDLNGRRVYDLGSLGVDDIAKLILEENLDENYFVQKARDFYPDRSISDSIVQRINFAYNRISKPLDLEEKILFLIFPFGVVNRLYENDFFDTQKELSLGFKRRVDEYYLFSLIGIVIYTIIGILVFYFL